MQPLLLLLLLPLAFLLPPGTNAGEIIGGHEAKPHSRPYMAYLQIWNQDDRSRCGGFLIREDFVLTAAHCWGSSINVTLGAHNIKKQERTQQVIPVRKAIRHPDYNKRNYANDIMLLQLQRKAKQTAAVRPLRLPGGRARVKPGQACDVAGWGRVAVAMNNYPDTLQEVKLIVQEDQKCESHLRNYYNNIIQLCVGDPKKKKASFKVRMTECLAWLWEIWDLRTQVVRTASPSRLGSFCPGRQEGNSQSWKCLGPLQGYKGPRVNPKRFPSRRRNLQHTEAQVLKTVLPECVVVKTRCLLELEHASIKGSSSAL
uniref:Granzyme B-like n=1 Tax=Camelus bactrianus TaxID=9837 RepID=A0A9W3F0P0_CAMBA